ncbi:MAG: putative glycosyltransferase [Chlamydiae bacterium]|nr:putative glycosyltransferase [Chlamydiota bacterium]
MKKISVVTPCFNEEDNIEEIYKQVKEVFKNLNYSYEHIFIDNSSDDQTVQRIKKIIEADKNVKLIINSRNFGHIRSPFYGMLQAHGDAVVFIVCDLQDPPQLIKEFIINWEQGAEIVIGIKPKSKEAKIMFLIRKLYYKISTKISEVQLIPNFLGFGLYDKKIIAILRKFDDPYPYFRGMIAEIGFKIKKVSYTQQKRKFGKTKNNFYSLYDIGILGLTSYSKVLMRLATFIGFGLSFISFLISVGCMVLKFLYWEKYSLGLASILVGLFFFSSIQLFFLGILGEYTMQVLTQTKGRPLVIEKERVNFES